MLVSTGNFPVTPRAYHFGGKAADQQTIRKPEDLMLNVTHTRIAVRLGIPMETEPGVAPMGVAPGFFMYAGQQ